MDPSNVDMSRRQALKMGGAALGLAGAGAVGLNLMGAGPASAHGTIVSHSEIWGQPTAYDGSPPSRSSFGYNPTFYSQMEAWMLFWWTHTPPTWGTPIEVWSLGVHNDGRVSEAHNAGRGFDLTRLRPTVSGQWAWGFETYTRWRSRTGSALTTARRRYWATAASLHYHFKNVLTYPYNSDHHSHIHIDNLVYGTPGGARFDTTSRAQVLHVQACLSYVWGVPTAIDGIWGTQTWTNSSAVIRRIGGTGSLTDHPDANWRGLNVATMRYGYGTQNY